MEKGKAKLYSKDECVKSGKSRCGKRSNICLTLMAGVRWSCLCLSSSYPDYIMWEQKVALTQSGELIWLPALQYPELQGTKYTAIPS